MNDGLGREETILWRGEEISHLEGLSDAVFAFAVTLLVVSSEVPGIFNKPLELIRGFTTFGICLPMLIARLVLALHLLQAPRSAR